MALKNTQGASKRRLVQLFTLISSLFLLVPLGASTVNLFSSATKVNQPEVVESEAEMLQKLQAQETGYESILSREPMNQTALEGLVNTRLAMDNSQGAIAPLETLVNLYPDRADYQSALDELKQETGDR
ncbi:tetratricopeptide repeat protein [Oculatella sp. LEGE 06141]|uniref:tetratricopeptide repeat protein n=1 Tax=Oculatella sp. LEGE 06141 TaxID=1828648 RepID=UPI00187EFAFE|nr:tetratricopeptide repeat protein [Oculatella sp. LEGE 06141]MBE9177204.1 tetratricopeptide repeat protein [Oculatella sp. LEGE 06141]